MLRVAAVVVTRGVTSAGHGDFAGGGRGRQHRIDHRRLPGLQQQLALPRRHAGELHRDGVVARAHRRVDIKAGWVGDGFEHLRRLPVLQCDAGAGDHGAGAVPDGALHPAISGLRENPGAARAAANNHAITTRMSRPPLKGCPINGTARS